MTTLRIDFLATETHYFDHLEPIYRALPDEYRGNFFISPKIHDCAKKSGFEMDIYLGKRVFSGNAGPIVTAASGDLNRANESGRMQIFCEHGAGQSYSNRHSSYAGGIGGRENVVLFLCPNEMAAARNRRYYPDVPAVAVGCPKLDEWHKKPIKPRSNPPVVAISFHWECFVCSETRSAYSWFKTALPELAKCKDFKLIGHGHPRMIGRIEAEYKRLGIEVVRDFKEVLERADCYVIDNSSTLFEFASTGRPVVVMNAPWYRRNMYHGLRFWEYVNIGVNCDNPRNLVDAIKLALEDTPEQKQLREQAVNAVYFVHDGTAAQKAVEAIIQVVETYKTKEYESRCKGMDRTMVAIRNFLQDERIQVIRPRKQGEKMVKPGTRFLTSLGYGKQLEARNLAVFVTENATTSIGPTENKPAGPSETKVVSPNEEKDDNKNVSQNASQNATQETKDPNIDLSEYPKHLGFGKYEMPDGSVIKGKEAALEAMEKFLSSNEATASADGRNEGEQGTEENQGNPDEQLDGNPGDPSNNEVNEETPTPEKEGQPDGSQQ